MSFLIVAAIILTGLVLSGLFSGSEIGLYQLNRLRLQLAVQRGDRSAERLARWVHDEQTALPVILIGNNVVNYLTTAAVAYLFADLLRLNEFDSQLYTMVLVTPTVFVFGEVVPKNLFHRHADALMRRMIWILLPTQWVLKGTGLVWLLKRVAALLNRVLGASSEDPRFVAPKRRVAALLQEALAGEQHGEWQSGVIDRVVLLSETALGSVMVPARSVTTIAATADRSELIRVARETGYARIPVHGDQRNQVVGIVKIDELLRREDWTTVGACAGPALSLYAGETVLSAITRMRTEKREAAVATNRFGQMVGLVTLRDLLQEVVGEGVVP